MLKQFFSDLFNDFLHLDHLSGASYILAQPKNIFFLVMTFIAFLLAFKNRNNKNIKKHLYLGVAYGILIITILMIMYDFTHDLFPYL